MENLEWVVPPSEVLEALRDRHGLKGPVVRLETRGMVNAVWQIGESHVLRIPRNDPTCLAETRVEAWVLPVAMGTGVRTPRRVAYDDSCADLPVPYSLWEKAEGGTFGTVCADPLIHSGVWREVGAEIARFHAEQDARSIPSGVLPEESSEAPWASLAKVRAEKQMRDAPLAWFERQLERLRPAFAEPLERVLLHDDLHPFNLLVHGEGESLRLSAILDWGDAGWGDPALEFVSIPIRAVPAAVEGYRSVRPLSEAAVGRILAGHLGVLLELLSLDPIPRASWWAEFVRFSWERPALFRGWLPADDPP